MIDYVPFQVKQGEKVHWIFSNHKIQRRKWQVGGHQKERQMFIELAKGTGKHINQHIIWFRLYGITLRRYQFL